MPKLIITTGGDEFFLPDDSYYFWDSLLGEKHLRLVKIENTTPLHCTVPKIEHCQMLNTHVLVTILVWC